MFELIITRADGSTYWTAYFNSLTEAQAWLGDEQTRPYWDASYTTQLIDHTPPSEPAE